MVDWSDAKLIPSLDLSDELDRRWTSLKNPKRTVKGRMNFHVSSEAI